MWRELTEDDIYGGAMMGPELDALRAAAHRAGDDDALPDTMEKAVDWARGFIGDCSKNRLAPGLTVPERVIHSLAAIVRVRVLTRLDITVSDGRMTEYKSAEKFFIRVSECKVSIEQPEGAIADDGNNETIEVISSSEREATRDKLRGL